MIVKFRDFVAEVDKIERSSGRIDFKLRNGESYHIKSDLDDDTTDFIYSEIASIAISGGVIDTTLFDTQKMGWLHRWFLQIGRDVRYLTGRLPYTEWYSMTWSEFLCGMSYKGDPK